MKLFKFMRRPDQLTVVGIVEVDGVAHKVKVLSPLLVQDAESWLADLGQLFEYEATSAERKGDFEAAAAMREKSATLGSCAAGLVKSSGIPAVDARLAVSVKKWPENKWLTWLRVMLKVSTPAGSHDSPDFLITERGMLVSEKLGWLRPYCSALPFEESSPAEVSAAARYAAAL